MLQCTVQRLHTLLGLNTPSQSLLPLAVTNQASRTVVWVGCWNQKIVDLCSQAHRTWEASETFGFNLAAEAMWLGLLNL